MFKLTCEHCTWKWEGINLRRGLWIWYSHMRYPGDILRCDIPIVWQQSKKGKWKEMGIGDAYEETT